MKDFIKKSGLTASQFAKKYDIPYNTVRQWAEGIRKTPAWLVKLFENENAYKPLCNEKIYICYAIYEEKTLHSRTIINQEQLNSWIDNMKKHKINGIIKECTVVNRIFIEYEGGENEI